MTRTLAVVLIVAAAACGGGSNDSTAEQQGELAFFEIYGVLGTVQQRALGTPATPVAPVAQPIAYNGPCTNGGTVSMQGTYDGDGSTNATFALDATFVACVEDTSKLDGALHWNGSVTPPIYTQTVTGSVAYEGATYAGTFGFDLTVTDDASTNMVTFGGTYTVGGMTYSAEHWISTTP